MKNPVKLVCGAGFFVYMFICKQYLTSIYIKYYNYYMITNNKKKSNKMKKIYQNSQNMLRFERTFWTGDYALKGYDYAISHLSYTVYEINDMQFSVTNEGHGYYKWEVKGLNNPYSGRVSSKSGALDIIRQFSKY